jgi:RimJ/RimL family protein N-acetyltransferase
MATTMPPCYAAVMALGGGATSWHALYAIAPLTPRDSARWHATLAAQDRENGADGWYFSPRSPREERPPPSPSRLAETSERLAAALTVPRWLRAWLALERSTGAIVGHVELSGGRLVAELHRCEVGLGILRAHHRRGLGLALMETALAWAREQPGLAWVDLGVFADNAPARALYARLGFVETSRTIDRFRIDGASIEDVQMTLRLDRG